MPRALLSWSGGKDSTLSLYEVRRKKTFEVIALLTALTRGYERVSMHGVRRELLRKQAQSVGLPVEEVWIPKDASNTQYESQMRRALLKHKRKGVRDVIFGDLFLQDIREYREKRLSEVEMRGSFPLWGKNTTDLAKFFVDEGFRAIVCCIDPRKLGKSFCGMEYDESFISKLPPKVDPCGENGEFHTYVYACPLFKQEIRVRVGRKVLRKGFYFADILPV